MIGLDTNVLVRYFAQDDKAQSAKATTLIESLSVEEPGYIAEVALIELVWVMSRAYGAERQDIAKILEALLRAKEFSIENADTVWKALKVFASSNADFADCLIERTCHDAQCEYTATFDAKAAKSAGLRLIK